MQTKITTLSGRIPTKSAKPAFRARAMKVGTWFVLEPVKILLRVALAALLIKAAPVVGKA